METTRLSLEATMETTSASIVELKRLHVGQGGNEGPYFRDGRAGIGGRDRKSYLEKGGSAAGRVRVKGKTERPEKGDERKRGRVEWKP